MKKKAKKKDVQEIKKELLELLEFEDFINALLGRTKDCIFDIIEEGREVEGWSIGLGRGRRYWKDKKAVEAYFPFLTKEDLFKINLKTPAELESLVGKKNLEVSGLVEKYQGKILKRTKDIRKKEDEELVSVLEAL